VFDQRLTERVGLALLTALTLSVAAVVALSGRTFAAVHEYHVFFSRIGDLKTGALVRLSGQEVGQVKAIAFASDGTLRVDLSVRRAFRQYVHENSEFYIASGATLLDEPSLEIGPPRGAPGPPLVPGAAVRGIDPPRLDRVLATVYDDLRAMGEQLHEQAPVIDELLRSFDHLLLTLGDIESEPGQLVRIRDQLGQAAVRGLDLLGALRAGTDDGVRIKRTAAEVSALTKKVQRDLLALSPRLDRAAAGLDRLGVVLSARERQRVASAFQKLAHATRLAAQLGGDVSALSAYVESGRGTVGGFLRDLEIVDDIKELNRMLENRPWLGIARPGKARPE